MTDRLRAAAEAALEALEKATRFMSDKEYRQLNETIEQLRAALAEPGVEQEPVAWQYVWGPGMYYTTDSRKTLDRYVQGAEDGTQTFVGTAPAGERVTVVLDGVELGTTVADASGVWRFGMPFLFANRLPPEKRGRVRPLYAAPPRREWVGLTDEEKRLFSSWLDEKPDAEVFAGIEAVLKEKNT